MLGYDIGVVNDEAPEGNGPIWLDDVECSGDETSIELCSHRTYGENNCGHSEDVGVICGKHNGLVRVGLNLW